MKDIDKLNSTPLYSQVADWIRERIYSKEWEADQQIPTEHVLMKQLDVSRGTLKKGISVLIKEGLLIQIQGKGTFVASSTVSHSFNKGLVSFAESLYQQGLEFETKVIAHRIEPAVKSVREKLSLPEEASILYLERVRYVDKEPIMVIENRINMDACKGIETIDFERHTLFSKMEELSGKQIKYAQSRFAARVIGKERAKFFETNENAPVLHLEQIVYLENDIAVEWGNVWLKSNRYMVGSILQR
ncbi:GntR family transcriptional regulator [Niallia sp. HCP3S3_B10]|uniref:GntR family transcriptional regulator n=1 Tax=Niallia sp. HCP3S3_B10 TaxID=3438944 RepID=UPI003F8B45E0